MPLLLALLFQSQEFGVRVEVQAIEVSASVRDGHGRLPRDLKPEDFVLLEDGKPQRIIGVAYVDSAAPRATEETPRPRQVVVYIQQSLATTDGLRIAMTALATEAETLAAMGEVEVVTDLPQPRSLIGPTRDAVALRGLLERMGKEAVGDEELIQMRRAFLVGDSQARTEVDVLARSDQIRMRAQREATTLRARQDAMLSWLGGYPRREAGTARALLYVSDGFDLDPQMFYSLDREDIRIERRVELRELSAAAHHAEVAQTLSAQGWTVVSMAMASNVRRMTEFKAAPRDRASMDVLGNSTSSVINRAPLAPLKQLADATGGSVTTDPSKIARDLAALDARVIITYQVDRAVDEKIRRVEVSSNRPGLTVQAQKWIR